MATLKGIEARIAKLQAQAELIKNRQNSKHVIAIAKKMQSLGVTIADLQAVMSSTDIMDPDISGQAKSSVTRSVAAKYRGPNNEAWSGRGITPKWLQEKIRAGHKKEDFLINA